MPSFTSIFAALALAASATAHLELTYPGTRGNNLLDNHGNSSECVKGTMDDYSGDKGCWPYGMEWMYPCGGLPVTTNRTYWPTTGGAVAFEPGWFATHSTAYLYVNLGIGTFPPNMSHPMVPMFQISGPSNEMYAGRPICFPQVGLPANLSLPSGTNATIQVVESAKHGAALYSCVDITLTDDMSLVQEVTPENCYNDTEIQFNMIFTTLSLNDAPSASRSPTLYGLLGIIGLVSAGMMSL